MKLLTQRYPLMTNRTAGKDYGGPCPMCGGKETMSHFLLRCKDLERDRHMYMQRLSTTLQRHDIRSPHGEEEVVRLILDPSNFTNSKRVQLAILDITRNLCFKLHHRRCLVLGRGSVYKSRGVLTKQTI